MAFVKYVVVLAFEGLSPLKPNTPSSANYRYAAAYMLATVTASVGTSR